MAYDEERGRAPYERAKHLKTVQDYFGGRCCYCGIDFTAANPAVEDHLIPTNRTELGLHAWGNIVPACRECNARKQGGDWRDFIIHRAGVEAAERHGSPAAAPVEEINPPVEDERPPVNAPVRVRVDAGGEPFKHTHALGEPRGVSWRLLVSRPGSRPRTTSTFCCNIARPVPASAFRPQQEPK